MIKYIEYKIHICISYVYHSTSNSSRACCPSRTTECCGSRWIRSDQLHINVYISVFLLSAIAHPDCTAFFWPHPQLSISEASLAGRGYFNINEHSVISSAPPEIHAALIEADHSQMNRPLPLTLSFSLSMHGSWFIYFVSCDHVFCDHAAQTGPLNGFERRAAFQQAGPGKKGSGLRRCQNGCFEREGMYYMAKTCPKATSHNKRDALKKKRKKKAQ